MDFVSGMQTEQNKMGTTVNLLPFTLNLVPVQRQQGQQISQKVTTIIGGNG